MTDAGHPGGYAPSTCDLCGGPVEAAVSDWTFLCGRCGLWKSSLVPAIDDPERHLSESDRFSGLEHVRLSNFERIFERLSRLTDLDSLRLLDIGCAYGWFLEAAVSHRMTAVGVEPDSRTAAMARARGLAVVEGYFPECLGPSDAFDVVVFNDTLEHIPDVQAMLAACSGTLTHGGLLVLSVPTSSGTLFRLARGLTRLGWTGPWRRLWQQAFPSPHVYYFNRENLDAALRAHGFTRVDADRTLVFHPKGLWSRMKFDRRSSRLMNALVYMALLAAYPFYRAFGQPDTELLIYRKCAPGMCRS
jgi:SAM-dependent methyltransferase